jgi:hypothetical protein
MILYIIIYMTSYNIHGFRSNVNTTLVDVNNSGNINFLTSASTIEAISTSVNDTNVSGSGARKVTVQGIDDNYDLISEELILQGKSISAPSSTSFLRVFKATVTEVGTYGGGNDGTITIRISGGGDTLLVIDEGICKSESSLFCVPRNKILKLKNIKINIEGKREFSVRLMKRESYDLSVTSIKPSEVLWRHNEVRDEYTTNFLSEITIPEKTDLWIKTKSSNGTGSINVDYDGILTTSGGSGLDVVVTNTVTVNGIVGTTGATGGSGGGTVDGIVGITQSGKSDIAYFSDGFNRLRISDPLTIFDSKQLSGKNEIFWDESLISGAGITGTHSVDTADVLIQSTLNTAGRYVRQTKQYFNYQPGKAQLIYLTGVLAVETPTATGGIRRVGYFDDNNGIFFEQNETGLAVGLRSSTSGSPVDTLVYQNNWNLDPLNGTGPDGVIIDITKTLIFYFNFEWLGVGLVDFGIVLNGQVYLCHRIQNSNVKTTVYMSTPNLPVRWELISGSSTPAISSRHICSSVISEGGVDNTALLLSSPDCAIITTGSDVLTDYVLMAIRLKDGRLGDTVNLEKINTLFESTNDYGKVTVTLNGNVSGGSLSFTSPSDVSSIEIAYGDGTIERTGGIELDNFFISIGNADGSNRNQSNDKIVQKLLLGSFIDGTKDIIYICYRPLLSTSTLYTCIQWSQFTQ